MKSGRGPGGSNGLVSSHPKCLIFQEMEETSGSLSFLPNRQLHSEAVLPATSSAALKLRREIKRESLILRSNTRTLKFSRPVDRLICFRPTFKKGGMVVVIVVSCDNVAPGGLFTASRSPVVSHCGNLKLNLSNQIELNLAKLKIFESKL